MMTLRRFSQGLDSVPTGTAWYLADLGVAVGKQELFARQSPQRLKTLREHALVESAVSSNRIEGIEVEPRRVATLVFGRASLQDRNEEEVRGYRDALRLIHGQTKNLTISEETIRQLHRLTRGEIWDAGRYKEQDSEIIEKTPDGRQRVRFRPVPAAQTASAMGELISLWDAALREQQVHPLILLTVFNLDFLCIHPFRDGNGPVSRLLLLLQCYHLGYGVGRYISLERLIEQNKVRYYETLEQSSVGWHDDTHDPWPYLNYLFFILKSAYREFEERIGQTAEPRGAKTERVVQAIERAKGSFSVGELQRECPGAGLDLIRATLKRLRAEGLVECLGRGQHASWQKTSRRK